MEFFIVAKQKRGFVLLTNSMAYVIEFGDTSLCRRDAMKLWMEAANEAGWRIPEPGNSSVGPS